MRDVVILSGVRTPFGRGVKGTLKDTRPDDLAISVVQESLRRSQIEPAAVEDVVLGCAFPEGEQGMNVARVIAMGAGLPAEVPAMTINRFCSSGVQAIAIVADRIAVGQIDVGLAGGLESMSMVPMSGAKPSLNPRLVESQPELFTPMGITAENVARKFGITRDEQDEFAYQSHQKAVAAQAAGYFNDEILPIDATVFDESGRPRSVRLDRDELPRADTDRKKLSALKPAFDPTGSVTPGNSSPLTDGAAAVVLAAGDQVGGRPKLGYFRSFAVAGVPPDIMGIGPVPAIRKLLARTGVDLGDIGLFELNEAFAAQSLAVVRELGLPADRVNVKGGAIALGHPLGCSGARILTTLVHTMRERGVRYGVASLCVGVGQGVATLLEAVEA